MNEVQRVISGRDGRVFLQKMLIRRSGIVVQISLNIPGFPKELAGEKFLLDAVAIYFREKAETCGWHPVCSIFIQNGAGSANLLELPGADPTKLQKIGMDIEDRCWGGILDIDVIGVDGAIHRRDLAGTERVCFACGRPAKLCAREQNHEFGFLREIALGHLVAGLEDML